MGHQSRVRRGEAGLLHLASSVECDFLGATDEPGVDEPEDPLQLGLPLRKGPKGRCRETQHAVRDPHRSEADAGRESDGPRDASVSSLHGREGNETHDHEHDIEHGFRYLGVKMRDHGRQHGNVLGEALVGVGDAVVQVEDLG